MLDCGGIYDAITLGLGLVLATQTLALIAIAGVAAVTLGVDALAVLEHRQSNFSHELIAFAAVCLAAPFAWLARSGHLEPAALGLRGLCSLHFGSSVLLKGIWVLSRLEGFRAAPIDQVAALESGSALLFFLLAALALLPRTLQE